MTLGRFPQDRKGKRLPRRYGGCTCICHRQSGVKHVAACCYPSQGRNRKKKEEDMNQNFGPTLPESLELPTAYGGCTCDCHDAPGVMHVMACCYPTQKQKEPNINFARMEELTSENNKICARLLELEDVEGNVTEMGELFDRQAVLLKEMIEILDAKQIENERE